MSTQIKPGDLVMVVKPLPCCGSTHSLGMVATVLGIGLRAEHRLVACKRCGRLVRSVADLLFTERPDGEMGYVERSRVIRIDPPAQTETTREEMAA